MAKPLEGRVRDIAHGGDAVIETEAGIVMARGALPGERVRVEILGKARGTHHGRVVARLEERPDRLTPRCPRIESCGGCPLMPMPYAAQLTWKQERVAHAVGLPVERVAMQGSPIAYGYRARARLAFRRVGPKVVLGYRAAGSHHVVDAPDCAVLAPALEAALARVRAELTELSGSGEVLLALAPGSERALVRIECEMAQAPSLYRAVEALAGADPIAGASLAIDGGASSVFGELPSFALDAQGARTFVPPFGFAQANHALNPLLVEHVLRLAEARDQRVLELYAGHGNFTLGLAAQARELLAVESDAAAAEACRDSLKARGLSHARVRTGDAAQLAGERGPVDVVVLDPPRTGAKDALAGIAARKPARIVYVSCDPATLQRDLGLLAALNYRVETAIAFDMFPHTPHVEALVRLTR
jgi:23S rRNA (uracil1939-C5)-methyltransferase